ncbi:hypothetical protein Pla108_39910 [Botrimarina colliarenosi]|uniref:PEP-CTERM protein-sorting domain-containing protein n=1 Tax=Botrimarina colliarenosi TaxID=2528001 RepID=A0A5C6A0T0_9BACT|nr:hypothetical protein [Botrimarina colliarenosi]TWT92851.1 hypothetical protein Pla108_39910 [Botrimarina colliarenosi]
MTRPLIVAFLAATFLGMPLASGAAGPTFVTDFSGWSNWNVLYAQGFSPYLDPSPDPGLEFGETVSLDRFQFFKAGLIEGAQEVAEPFRLAIVSNYFVNLTGLTTEDPAIVGLSTNAINGSASTAVGDPFTFNFDGLELDYFTDYAALYVTESGGLLTPALVPSMIVGYVETEPGSEVYVPEADYGDPDGEYQYAASNFINDLTTESYLATFNAPYADASFLAYYNLEPLAGDYNDDGVVDAADYTVWRDQSGESVALPNETVTEGMVTPEDYDEWALHYGDVFTLPVSVATTVPEPGSLSVSAGMVVLGLVVRRVR